MDKTRSINIKTIHDTTHHRFKLACLKNDISMRDALVRFMKYYGDKYTEKPEQKD